MYRDAYPSDRFSHGAAPQGADSADGDDHEAAWERHLRQFAHAAAPRARPADRGPARPAQSRRRGPPLLLLTAAAVPALAAIALHGRSAPDAAPPARPAVAKPGLALPAPMPVRDVAASAPKSRPAAAAPARHAWILDPTPMLGSQTSGLADTAPLGPAFRTPTTQVASAEAPLALPPAKYERAPLLQPAPAGTRTSMAQQAAPQVALLVPLPQRRPADLVAAAVRPETRRLAERPDLPSTRTVFRAAIGGERSADRERSSSGSALAYAGTNNDAIEMSPRARLGLSPNPASGATAIYDISAQRVYLPSGRVLEAHSGLGPYKDDPRYVHLRMRGATPPGTYDLTERERPYHGVRALRMTPVGGPAAVHGRNGLLAHTYLLRERGASHGCVVFADYPAFLNAYLRGEIRRLVVVAGRKGDAPPVTAENGFGLFGRWASAGD